MRPNLGLLMLIAGVAYLPQQAAARLGDTEAQLVKRFGEPDRVLRGRDQAEQGADRTLVFFEETDAGVVELQVGLIDDESVAEVYFFMNANGDPDPITPAKLKAVEAFLQLNSQGHVWTPIPVHLLGDSDRDGRDDYVFAWTRSDNKRTTALVQSSHSHALIFHSDKYKRAREASSSGAAGF